MKLKIRGDEHTGAKLFFDIDDFNAVDCILFELFKFDFGLVRKRINQRTSLRFGLCTKRINGVNFKYDLSTNRLDMETFGVACIATFLEDLYIHI